MADNSDRDDVFVKLLVLHELLKSSESTSEDTYSKLTYIGQRVVRGPDWKWDNQDGGEGHVGTVVEISNTLEKTVAVQWDCGYRGWYRVGIDGAFDLRMVDNASVGVKHSTVTCDSCRKNEIFGIRWKCDMCLDFDLCNLCYMGDKHDVSHTFLRIGVPDAPRVQVPKREGATKIQMRGIFSSALVVRGPDWAWEDQDGGNGKIGLVRASKGWENKADRNAVDVLWIGESKKLSKSSNLYRVGHIGKVDLKYIRDAAGGFYYKDHLPILGDEMREVPCEESSSTITTKVERQKGLLFLSESMKNPFLSDKFSDLTIKVKDRVFPVHKFIISARSTVLESMLPESGTVLDIPDCDPLVFEEFLYYLYTGTLKLAAHVHIDDLHNLAQRYNFKALKLECIRLKNSAAKDKVLNFIAAA